MSRQTHRLALLQQPIAKYPEMSGLIFLAALTLGLLGMAWLAKTIGNAAVNPSSRTPIKVGVFLTLLSAPFADEAIGKFQFEHLCSSNGIEGVNVSKARNKRVKTEYGYRQRIDAALLPIFVDTVRLRDADGGDVLVEYKDYHATGGWLMRDTPIGMGSSSPMLFNGNGCGFKRRDAVFSANRITEVK